MTVERDESMCEALYRQGHAKYLEKTWNEAFDVPGEVYPYYDAGYFEVGDYYAALFVKTPTPQDDDPSEIRLVTGYSTALFYSKDLEKIAGYSF